jgi:prevent-host-death family protein
MAKQVSVSEARANLPALLDEVTEGEEVTITRHGKPVAVLVRPRRLRHPAVQKLLDDADARIAAREAMRDEPFDPFEPIDLPPGWADQRVAELRADRDAE